MDYLDTESINGLNLYCYCKNNPIMYVDPSGHYTEYSIINDIYQHTTSILQLLVNGVYVGSYFSVVNAVRPNNIGLGIWNKQRAATISSFADDAKVLNKVGNVFAAIGVGVQVFVDVLTDLERGYSTDRIISNMVVNTAVYSGITVGLTYVGAFVGLLIPIPILGTAIGAAAGYVLSIGVDHLLNLEINGKLLIDHARDWVYDTWTSIFN